MHVLLILLFFFIVIAVAGVIEYSLHQKRVYSIPIRIHVNGTRGKSSVSRLIGAGLNSGGVKTITKVTGTYPRLILEDSTETAVYRKANANIIEQLNIVRFASARKADALVIECMALEPQYQWITENQMIHATVGVITNVRLDHVDVMGYTIPEIAEVLGYTIPANKVLFTAEEQNFPMLKKIAGRKNSGVHTVNPSAVSDIEMEGFSYIEHKENVALSLAVCSHFGIDRQIALKGMYKVNPDAGALVCTEINESGKEIFFFNAFAANDPQSTLMIWKRLAEERKLKGNKIILLNTRQDRLDRARQLAEMISRDIHSAADYLILIGQSTEIVESMCTSYGYPKEKIINLSWTSPESVFDSVATLTDNISTVVAIGNIGGMGAMVQNYFVNRSLVYD
jgi:gamma-polyglutamate synthase